MPRANEKHRLLTEDQACAAIVQIERELQGKDPREIFYAISWDTILHRTLYRDYYGYVMKEPGHAADPEALLTFAQDFALRFKAQYFDFAVASRPQQIARAHGWTNLIGWDKASNEIVQPLTHVFKMAVAQSFIAQQFHDSAVARRDEKDPYRNIIMAYVDYHQKHGNRLPYLGVVLTQVQVSEFAIRARDKFETQMKREMSATDWDMLSPQIGQLLTRLAAGSRFDLFKNIATVACADQPFVLRALPDGQIKLLPTMVSEKAVVEYMHDTNGQKFFERYAGLDTTGCPAVFSRGKSEDGQSGASYLTQVIGQFLNAVREDFWPQAAKAAVPTGAPAVAAPSGCPFHHASPAA